jgi:protein O-GlcNAc transferase
MGQDFFSTPGFSQLCVGAALDLDAWHREGCDLLRRGRRDEAEAVFRRIISVNSRDAVAWCYLGVIREARSQLPEAEAAYRRALTGDPRLPQAHSNLGGVLNRQGRHQEAEAACRHAIHLAPDLVEGRNNLAVALKELGRLAEAEQVFQRVLATRPDLPQVEANLAAVLRAMGRMEEAGRHAGRAIELGLDDAALFSDWLSSQQYVEGADPARLAALHAGWDRRYATRLPPIWRPDLVRAEPDRRLRLGFVSPDLCYHPVGFFLIRTLENLDPAEIEIICYNDRAEKDRMTERFRAVSLRWRDVLGRSHDLLAEQIRDDGIDILVDLAGHTGGNRMLTFARRPAPVQVTWIGYEGTTGLSEMDFLLGDRYMTPEEDEPYYREKIVRLPDCYLCYEPFKDSPEVSPLPASETGHVTFGSCNNLGKINQGVVAAWAEILHRVPGSRLLMKYGGLEDESMQARFLQLFAAHGVGAERITFEGWSPLSVFLDRHGRIDIALDTFPFSGGATTCHALWMGVPVVTWPGKTFAGRHSLSYLSTVALTETIAASREEYVQIAVALAVNLPRLAAIRAGLRQKMAASPLCDGTRFAQNLTTILRNVWREWCLQVSGSSDRNQ